jgi:succinate-semialdehyde dehydrogenase/glutarate-semialdehyde dehydrogenase
MDEAQVQVAVKNAWEAFASWSLLTYHQRAKKIKALHDIIEKNADDIAKLVTNEVGKPLSESYLSELTGPLDTCNWLIDNVERALSDQAIQLSNPLLSSKQSLISFEPLGVVGIIAPWNYPFSIPMMSVIAAVMLGNTVVLKPSEKSPLSGVKIGELFKAAGFPENVVSVVTGDRSTGASLSKAKLSKLMFTGSVEGGKKILEQVSSNLTPVTLELGGKDAAIILPDAPVDWTARGIVWGAFTNAGQACASIERIYIVKGKNTDNLVKRIVEHTKNLKVGNACDPGTEVGPIIDAIQLKKVNEQVQEALSAGAIALCGGNQRNDLGGYFFEPTILTNVNHSMKVMKEETFGPVVSIMLVDTEKEAIDLANDSDYGLTASIWSANVSKAEKMSHQLNVGTVLINDCLYSHASPEVPWGGVKISGFGRNHSYFGLLELVNIKHIALDKAGGEHRIWWYPYGAAHKEMAKGGLSFLHGTSFIARIKGAVGFLTNKFKN